MNPILAWTFALTAMLSLGVCWYVLTPAIFGYHHFITETLGASGPTTFINGALLVWDLFYVIGILGIILWAVVSSHETEYESAYRR